MKKYKVIQKFQRNSIYGERILKRFKTWKEACHGILDEIQNMKKQGEYKKDEKIIYCNDLFMISSDCVYFDMFIITEF